MFLLHLLLHLHTYKSEPQEKIDVNAETRKEPGDTWRNVLSYRGKNWPKSGTEVDREKFDSTLHKTGKSRAEGERTKGRKM